MHSLAHNLFKSTGCPSFDSLGISWKILRLLADIFTPSGRKNVRPDVEGFQFKSIFFNVARSLSAHWSCSGIGVHRK